jgi:hypothetical protein
MAFLATALPYISAAVGVAGAVAQSNNQQAQTQAGIYADQMNADAEKQQAAVALQQAGIEEEDKRRENRAFMAEQRAQIAESGTGLLSSTNQNLVLQSAKAAEQDALNIRYGGLLEAHGLIARSKQSEYQATAKKAQMGGIRASGYLSAVGAGLSGYSSGGGRFSGRT